MGFSQIAAGIRTPHAAGPYLIGLHWEYLRFVCQYRKFTIPFEGCQNAKNPRKRPVGFQDCGFSALWRRLRFSIVELMHTAFNPRASMMILANR